MKLDNLRDLYLQELRDLYNAETQILKALPKMAKAASSPKLQEAFQEHIEQTRKQIERLGQVFVHMGMQPKGHKCEGMEGILSEGEQFFTQKGAPSVRDAALIASAQKVEHYEICGYGTVRALAKTLGDEEAFNLIGQTLEEEKRTDKNLTKLAEQGVNKQASSQPSSPSSSRSSSMSGSDI